MMKGELQVKRVRWAAGSLAVIVVVMALVFFSLPPDEPISSTQSAPDQMIEDHDATAAEPIDDAREATAVEPIAEVHEVASAEPSPVREAPIASPGKPASGASAPVAPSAPSPGVAAWQPPATNDPVFDLNGDRSVGDDEQTRASEILEHAADFARDHSPDGSFPILREAFTGDGRQFTAMDVDSDGALSEREFIAFHVDSIKQVRRFDQNRDGAVTLAEFGVLASRFDFLDVDHDGQLWAWEISIMRGRGRW